MPPILRPNITEDVHKAELYENLSNKYKRNRPSYSSSSCRNSKRSRRRRATTTHVNSTSVGCLTSSCRPCGTRYPKRRCISCGAKAKYKACDICPKTYTCINCFTLSKRMNGGIYQCGDCKKLFPGLEKLGKISKSAGKIKKISNFVITTYDEFNNSESVESSVVVERMKTLVLLVYRNRDDCFDKLSLEIKTRVKNILELLYEKNKWRDAEMIHYKLFNTLISREERGRVTRSGRRYNNM